VSATLSVLMLAPSASGKRQLRQLARPTIGPCGQADQAGKTAEAIALLDPLVQQKPSVAGVETCWEEPTLQASSISRPSFICNVLRNRAGRLGVHPATGSELLRSGKLPGNLAPVGKSESSSPPRPGGCSVYPCVCYARTQQWESARKAFAGMFGVSRRARWLTDAGQDAVRLQLEDQAPPRLPQRWHRIPVYPWLISCRGNLAL